MGYRRRDGRCAQAHRTAHRNATGGTGVFTPATQSELASQAGKFLLRTDCGDGLCAHAHCARTRKQRADAAKRAAAEPGRCGKPTRRGTCRSPAGACAVHDRHKPTEFAW